MRLHPYTCRGEVITRDLDKPRSQHVDCFRSPFSTREVGAVWQVVDAKREPVAFAPTEGVALMIAAALSGDLVEWPDDPMANTTFP